jgi:hypothetical protein
MDQLPAEISDEHKHTLEVYAEAGLKLIRENSGIDSNYDRQSIEWLDHRLNEVRNEETDASHLEHVRGIYGSFLGKALIETYGGKWVRNDGYLGIKLASCDVIAYPFAKVEKQISHDGEYDSILGFFDLAPNMDSIMKERSK